MKLTLSRLPKTWILDLDGLVVAHNGHLHGGDRLLPGVAEFWNKISPDDTIILLTAREASRLPEIRGFFASEGLRLDHVITGCPVGERILLNDCKPSGLRTAFAVNAARDTGLGDVSYQIDPRI